MATRKQPIKQQEEVTVDPLHEDFQGEFDVNVNADVELENGHLPVERKRSRNPLLQRITQDDYEVISEDILLKLEAFFRGIEQTPEKTRRLIDVYIDWESTKVKREIESRKQALEAELARLQELEQTLAN